MTTQDTNPVAYARGVLQVEAETARRDAARITDAAELLLAALDGGQHWEVDLAITRLVTTLNQTKERP